MNIEKYFCDRCTNNLPIDNFYSYKKSICKECINKKVKCEFCSKKFNSSNLTKHKKLIHGTYNSSNITDKNKSTSDEINKNNSTSIIPDKNKSTSNTKKDLIKSTSGKSTSATRTENKSTSNTKTNLHKSTSSSTKENKNTSNIKNTNNTYNEKDVDKINLLLSKARIIQEKISLGTINQKEKRNFTTIIIKLLKLKYFNKDLVDEFLN